jgi:hypothetical protein
MIIHCTQKLAKKLPNVSEAALVETSPLGSWTGNLYPIDRRQCALLPLMKPAMFSSSRACARRSSKNPTLHRQLFRPLARQGVTDTQLKKIALALGPARFDRATDRSVLGSMNTVIFDMEVLLMSVSNVMELDTATLLSLNHRPATIKGKWLWPDKAMMEGIDLL